MIFITIKKLQKKKVLILEKSLSPIVYLKLMALSGRLGRTVHKDLRWHNSQSMLYRKSWVFSWYSGFLPQGMLTGWVGINRNILLPYQRIGKAFHQDGDKKIEQYVISNDGQDDEVYCSPVIGGSHCTLHN